MTKKIIVLGQNGQLGSELQQISTKNQVVFFDSTTLDVTNEEMLSVVLSKGWDICINATAYTAVDKAETDKETAYAVNAVAVKNIALLCKQHNIVLYHISTDYVFAGDSTIAYQENDPVAPINYYGASKLDGELFAIKNNPKTYIIRTSWVYSEFGNNFVKTMLRLAETKTELNVVGDQIGSPTYARDLARAIFKMIDANREDVYGIYHFTNTGKTNWAEFAQTIFRHKNLSITVTAIPSSEYPTPAKRPAYSLLATTKIEQTFGLTIPHWKDSLKELLEKI